MPASAPVTRPTAAPAAAPTPAHAPATPPRAMPTSRPATVPLATRPARLAWTPPVTPSTHRVNAFQSRGVMLCRRGRLLVGLGPLRRDGGVLRSRALLVIEFPLHGVAEYLPRGGELDHLPVAAAGVRVAVPGAAAVRRPQFAPGTSKMTSSAPSRGSSPPDAAGLARGRLPAARRPADRRAGPSDRERLEVFSPLGAGGGADPDERRRPRGVHCPGRHPPRPGAAARRGR